MKAKMFCPTHGKLEMDNIIIKNREPVCGKCFAALEFGDVNPRKVRKK